MRMKRWLTALLSVVMVLALIPMETFAAERPQAPASCEAENSNEKTYTCHRVEENEVYVAGTKVGITENIEYYLNDENGGITSENASSDNYNVSYDPASGTITLNGANLSKTSYTDHLVLYETQQYPRDVSDDAVIMARRNITIKVIGENVVENKRKAPDKTYTGLHRHGIDVFANLTITGDGTESSKLTVRSSDQNDGEWANSVSVNVSGGNLTVENVSLTAQGRQTTYCSAGMYVVGGSAEIRNSNVEILSGAVKPLNEAAVAVSWTGSYGLVSEDGDIVIDNSSVNVQAGEGYYSSGVYIISPDDELMIKNNSVLKVTASKEAAVSYGISGSLTVDKAYVEAKSEGAKDISYTYGGVSYGGDAYSYGYSGYTYDQDNNIISYKVNVEKGSVRFMSGPCSSGTDTFSCAYDGYIADLDYSSDPYALAKYNQSANAENAQAWTEDCGAADQENRMVLQNNYQYFEITHEFTPTGTVEWIGDDPAQRPDSLEIALQNVNTAVTSTTATSNNTNKWALDFGVQSVYNCQITGDYRASNAWDTINYNVAVNNQPEKYDTAVSGSAYSEGGFYITETYIEDEKPSEPPEEPDKPSEPGETPSDPSEPSKPGETPSEPPTDTDKPSGDQTGDTTPPQTGDDSNIALWIAVLLSAGAALTGTAVYSRKRKYSR